MGAENLFEKYLNLEYSVADLCNKMDNINKNQLPDSSSSPPLRLLYVINCFVAISKERQILLCLEKNIRKRLNLCTNNKRRTLEVSEMEIEDFPLFVLHFKRVDLSNKKNV